MPAPANAHAVPGQQKNLNPARLTRTPIRSGHGVSASLDCTADPLILLERGAAPQRKAARILVSSESLAANNPPSSMTFTPM